MHNSNQINRRDFKQDATAVEASSDGRSCVIKVQDAELILMANRLAWWPTERTLLVADSHFGKAATFRKFGLPVPTGTTARMLETLSTTLENLRPVRLVILGDFVHSVTQADTDFERELAAWRERHSSLSITLILGNHDRHRLGLFHELALDVRDQEVCGPFRFCHDPFALRVTRKTEFAVGGHIHPGIRLGKHSQKMPCFWHSKDFLILPAFGPFTGMARISPQHDDNLFVIADGQIARICPGNKTAPSRPTGAEAN